MKHMRLGLLCLILAAGLAGCVPKTGTVKTSMDSSSPLVSISAGTAPVGKSQLYANYLIDRATHDCYFATFNSVQHVSCCRLIKGLAAARRYVTWLSPSSCNPDAM